MQIEQSPDVCMGTLAVVANHSSALNRYVL